MFELVVKHPFAGRIVGDVVSDPGAMEAVLQSAQARFVVRRYAKEKPAAPVQGEPR